MSEDVKKKEPAWLDLVRNVSDNPAAIKWPADHWGFTSEIKQDFVALVGKLRGHPAKTEILLATLAVMTAHVRKRGDKDDRIRSQRRAFVQAGQIAREPLERFSTNGSNNKEIARGKTR